MLFHETAPTMRLLASLSDPIDELRVDRSALTLISVNPARGAMAMGLGEGETVPLLRGILTYCVLKKR